MSKNLTDESLRVIGFARAAARSLKHTCLGTEHVLVGIFRVNTPAAALVFERLGLDRAALRAAFLAVAPCASATPKNQYLPLSARLVASLEAAARAARDLERPRIAPEHLLFGVLSDETSTACKVLARAGIERARALGETLAVLRDVRPLPTLEMAPEVKRSIDVLELATSDLKELMAQEMERSPTVSIENAQPAREFAPVPPARPVELPLFICPRSHGPMEKLKGPEGLEIGLCPECMGTFVPAGQLSKLVLRAADGTLDSLFERLQE